MRFLKGFGFVLLCLGLLLGAIYAVEDWRGARAWETTVREVKEHGGTTDFAVVIPPPVPDDQNLAMAPFFVKALNYQIDPEIKQLTFGKPKDDPLLAVAFERASLCSDNWKQGRPTNLSIWQACLRADPAFSQAPAQQSPADEVLISLSPYKATLEEVAMAAVARPRSRFPINWTAPDFSPRPEPHVPLLRNLAADLSIRASAEVASGKQADAAADIALAFRLTDAIVQSSQTDDSARVTILGVLEQPIWDGLAARSWDADQLPRLQALLSRQDTLAAYASAIRAGEALAVHGIERMKIVAPTDLPLSGRVLARMVPNGWYDQNKSRIVHYLQKYALAAVDPARRLVFPSIVAAGSAETEATRMGPYTLLYLALCQPHVMGFEETLLRAARAQTDCDQAAIACALERYFLDHHSYPAGLAALTPDYITTLPTDVIDGAPMHYQRTPDGRYRLYSIGWNARDDGGQPAWTGGPRLDDRNGDWVWQYEPIKPPEFRQNYQN